MHAALDIARPWPTIRRLAAKRVAHRRAQGDPWFQARYRWAKWYQPWSGWMHFWYVGPFELYWSPAITIWRRDRDGAYGPRWKVTCPLFRDIRRRLLTRCEWCGGPSRKGDYVNVGGHAGAQGQDHNGARIKTRWWRGERGLYHGDCSSIAHAKSVCICGPEGGPWEHELDDWPYGRCAACGKYRGWLSAADRTSPTYPGLHTNRLLAAIPDGQRDPKVMEIVREMWAFHREGKLL